MISFILDSVSYCPSYVTVYNNRRHKCQRFCKVWGWYSRDMPCDRYTSISK